MTITESTALEAQTASEFRCSLVHFTEGRCGRSNRTELHHIKYRSHGGGDEAGNLLPLCTHHHNLIHEGRLKWTEHEGMACLREDVGAASEIVFEYWYQWPDVREGLEGDAVRTHTFLEAKVRQVHGIRIEVAMKLAEMDQRCLYDLLGYDSIHEYGATLGFAKSSTDNALRVGSFLLDHPEAVRQIQESGLPYTALRDSVAKLKRLGPAEQDEQLAQMCEMAEDDVPGQAIVAAVKSSTPMESEVEWHCTARLVGGSFSLDLTAPTPEIARAKVRAILGRVGVNSGVYVSPENDTINVREKR